MRYDEQGRLYTTSATPAAATPTNLGLFIATGNSTGVTTGNYIQLRQLPPAAPEWYNITTQSVLANAPANIGPIGGNVESDLVTWQATSTNSTLGYTAGDYLSQIVNTSTGGSSWFNNGTAITGTPPLSERTIAGGGGSSSSGIPITYDIVDGATGQQGIWNVSANTVRRLGTTAAITIGPASGNATNLVLAGGSAAVIQTDTYRAIQANATAGIVNGRQYLRRQILSASGAVLSTAWTDLELGTLLNTTQVAAIDISADFDPGSATSTVTGTRLRSQDWIVVANGGDTASGLARYAIAREFITEDAPGTVTAPFWTNSADTVITAPTRTNLVKVEQGYPTPVSVKYALNNAPTVLLNGYAVRLPNNVIELYSDFTLSTLVTQGTSATEAIASSIVPTERRTEENTSLPKTPTILWHTFTATRTERVFNLVNARNWAIANNGGVPIQYAYTVGGTTTTPFFMAIPPSVQVFPVSGQNYTGPLALSIDLLPTPVNLLNGTSVDGSDQVTFAAALPADEVVPRQVITGPGIPANTFIKNWNSTRTIVSLCDANGVAVNAAAGAGAGTFISSGAPVLLEVWN